MTEVARLATLDDYDRVEVPDGSYIMGGKANSDHMEHRVFVDTFWVSRFLVTNERFVNFLNATGITNEVESVYVFVNTNHELCRIRKGASGEYNTVRGYERHPVTQVNWHGASAYCTWVGGKLPTEAQWERAARLGFDQALYPWGDEEPSSAKANYAENVGDTTEIGAYPSDHVGIFDLAGNVWEWCGDWYSPNYYLLSPRRNPTGPRNGVDKVLRGGAWSYDESCLTCCYRGRAWPRLGGTAVGFRVVW